MLSTQQLDTVEVSFTFFPLLGSDVVILLHVGGGGFDALDRLVLPLVTDGLPVASVVDVLGEEPAGLQEFFRDLFGRVFVQRADIVVHFRHTCIDLSVANTGESAVDTEKPREGCVRVVNGVKHRNVATGEKSMKKNKEKKKERAKNEKNG